MLEVFLVPEKTVVTERGDGAAVEVSSAQSRVLLLTLTITDIVEQEALDVSIWGSAEGNAWGQKPLIAFPQKFYRGEHPLLLDLAARPEVKHVRAHWEVNRWGRGSETPMFQFQLSAKEVPTEMLQEARSRGRSG